MRPHGCSISSILSQKRSEEQLWFGYMIGYMKLPEAKQKPSTRVVEGFLTPYLLEPVEGLEPTTSCLQNSCSTTELHRRPAHIVA